ncbi:MAG: SPL family radical SAM protein [Saccharofermentanales bacterium]
MKESDPDSFSHRFSHVYIESGISDHPLTKRILAHLNHPSIIWIDHYKDVFCKKSQNFGAQKGSRQMIIASKKPPYLYRGSALCDSFGHDRFFYSTNAMNCVYDCEYCYLQGRYPSANLVVFVNTEELFKEVDDELARHPVYLCNSYDTDLMAMEQMTGFCSGWIGFARHRPGLTLEIRTKSAAFHSISALAPAGNVILAWSVSPQEIIARYERFTPSASMRIKAMREAIDAGWQVRLCIDPILRTDGWKEQYDSLARAIRSRIDIDEFCDYSIGVFRVPEESLKAMRRINPGSELLAFPFSKEMSGDAPENCRSVRMDPGFAEAAQKVYTYSAAQRAEMTAFMEECIRK